MAIVIEVNNTKITLHNGKWSSDNKLYQQALSLYTPDLIRGYTPWPDYTLAEMACKELDGKIIETTDPPEYVEGRIY